MVLVSIGYSIESVVQEGKALPSRRRGGVVGARRVRFGFSRAVRIGRLSRPIFLFVTLIHEYPFAPFSMS